MQQPRLQYAAARRRRQRLQHCGSERRRHCHQVSKIHLGFFGPKSVSGRLVVVERAPRRRKPHNYFFLTFEKNISIYNNDYAAHLKKYVKQSKHSEVKKSRAFITTIQIIRKHQPSEASINQILPYCACPACSITFFLIYCPILIKVRSNFSPRLNVET